jgi:hypothetical protein
MATEHPGKFQLRKDTGAPTVNFIGDIVELDKSPWGRQSYHGDPCGYFKIGNS